jgi:hypothetical protein
MPIYITMANPREPDPPAPADDPQVPASDPTSGEAAPSGASGEAGITPEQLAKIVKRLEGGFYDRPDVREQIARRALDDLDQ